MAYEPPFSLNDRIVSAVANIAQKVGRIEGFEQLDRSPQLRKENRIKTIHSSLAIENNSLSIEQVTAVVEGRHVIAPPKDLLEVQNAIKAYEALFSFDPTSMDSLLTAHRVLMGGLVNGAGCFRSGNVGVFDGGELIHAGTPAAYVPEVMRDLFGWLRSTAVHPLIASCVFHYEFEFIHPFTDGNGRMGRLWQTLILSKWNPIFAWLPVESLVKENQEGYYAALGASDASGDSSEFLVFMLSMIDAALDDVIQTQERSSASAGASSGIKGEAAMVRARVLALLKANPTMTMAQIGEELGISRRQAERIAASLKAEGLLVRVGANRNGHWEVP